MPKKKKTTDEITDQFPGRSCISVTFEDGTSADVFPLGLKEVIVSSREFAALVSVVREMGSGARDDGFIEVLFNAAPHVLQSITQLVGRCVRFRDEKGLPDDNRRFQDMVALDCVPVIDAWWDASFSGKRERFCSQVDRLASRIAGREISISEMVSNFFSKLDTPEETSSTTTKTDGPTEDGA